MRRSPYGERGLKSYVCFDVGLDEESRSPYGERGLKSETHDVGVMTVFAAPRMGSVD